MSVPKDRPQPGPGAPLTTEREQYSRLMAQGLNNHQACLPIGVHPSTGWRWSKGRNMVDHTGKARYYPPIHAEPKAFSPRYLSEEERILIGDLLAAGHSQRSVAAQLRRSPVTCLIIWLTMFGLNGQVSSLGALRSAVGKENWCIGGGGCSGRHGADVSAVCPGESILSGCVPVDLDPSMVP
jgi:hypothetical protein